MIRFATGYVGAKIGIGHDSAPLLELKKDEMRPKRQGLTFQSKESGLKLGAQIGTAAQGC